MLTINHSPPKNTLDAEAYPESYQYTLAILAPGEPPNLRGHRMAGIDNSDNKHVRDQIEEDPQLGRRRAHRHFPDWEEPMNVRGRIGLSPAGLPTRKFASDSDGFFGGIAWNA